MPNLPARRSPTLVQRLSDRRRELALSALAIAGLLGIRSIFAGRRRDADRSAYAPLVSDSRTAQPPPRPEPTPEPAAPAPAPAEPESAEPTEPVTEVQPAVPQPSAVPDPEPVGLEDVEEPTAEELAAAEVAVLAILSQEGRVEGDRTALAVATTLERDTAAVAAIMRRLSAAGEIAGDEYTAAGERIWSVTTKGEGRL